MYLVLTRPTPIRGMTGCTESDFCFENELEAFDAGDEMPFGAYAIPVSRMKLKT